MDIIIKILKSEVEKHPELNAQLHQCSIEQPLTIIEEDDDAYLYRSADGQLSGFITLLKLYGLSYQIATGEKFRHKRFSNRPATY
jgi:hypothetical protein